MLIEFSEIRISFVVIACFFACCMCFAVAEWSKALNSFCVCVCVCSRDSPGSSPTTAHIGIVVDDGFGH